MSKEKGMEDEAEFKAFVQNMKEAIDEDIAHPENFEEDPEQLEAFREISQGLGNIDNLSRMDLFQLGMEIGGMIHMMELSNEIFDALQDSDEEDDLDEDESSEEWEEEWEEDFSESDVESDKPKNDKPKGSCGNCGCH